MHRFVLSSSRSALRQTYTPCSLTARGVSSSSAHHAEAAAAQPAAAAAAASSVQQSAASILRHQRNRSSSATFIQYAPTVTHSGNKSAKKKTRQPHANVAPLLTRLWGKNGKFKTLAPEDWSNIILNNRRRLLQMKEKEQYRTWMQFQKLKAARFAWLKEQGLEVSPEMRARIEQRERSIIEMTKEARANITAPVPQLPLPKQPQSDRGKAMSMRARSEPQTFLKLQLPQSVWRVFTFRLTHYHSHILHRQMEKFRELAKRLGLSPSRATYLPHKMKKFNIIRSPHVDKTSREQYETRLYSLKISISPSVDKFYAIQRLCELSFRLINGNVKMRIETPPNQAIESVTFAPNPLKAGLGHTPMQIYSVRDSPGIENILYKFDQHQFPFLMDWQEEILDEKFRGIYPKDFDVERPYPLPGEQEEADKIAAKRLGHSQKAGDADEAGAAFVAQSDEAIFDEAGEFAEGEASLGDADFEGDEVAEESEKEAARFDVEDDRDDMQRMEDLYDERVQPLVKRKRRHE